MRTIAILVLIFLFSTSFNLGSGPAYLTCKSESGRTMFKAEIIDIDETLEKAVLTVDGEKLQFTNKDEAYCIFDDEVGVYSIYIVNDATDFGHQKFLQFWSIPSTFKTIINTRTHKKYEFRAKLHATEPRSGKERQTPVIEVICSLEYEI